MVTVYINMALNPRPDRLHRKPSLAFPRASFLLRAMICLPALHAEGERGCAPEQDLLNLRRVFDTCDGNGDGFLTLEELCEWMQKLGFFLTNEGLKELIHSCDRDLDGRLDFNEFVELSATLVACNHAEDEEAAASSGRSEGGKGEKLKEEDAPASSEDPELRDAFLVFDKDGNGLISPVELKSTLSQLGLLSSSTSFSRIRSMIRRVDTDGDGEVNFAEFQNMMRGSVSA